MMFARDKAAHNNVRGINEGAKEMIGEPRKNPYVFDPKQEVRGFVKPSYEQWVEAGREFKKAETTGEPDQHNKPIHPCGAGFQRFERFVFLLAIVVVLLDVFVWRAG